VKDINVYLIGGAPGAGKTTLGMALAARLGIKSLTIDDLVTAGIAVTSPDTHPGLHRMRQTPYLEYYTTSSIDRLIADAIARHEASWPMVEAVVRKYANRNSAIVIDGWHLRPDWVAQMELTNIWSGWIVTSAGVLEEREKKNVEWMKGSSNPEKMFRNFLARSLWYNDLIEAQAAKHQMEVLSQTGSTSVEEFCAQILERLSKSSP
jgi:2-phosphoglycerate kinase